MSFTDIAPAETGSSKTGIGFSLSAGKKHCIARMTFTAKAQEEIFEGPIAGKRFKARVGRGQDEGRLLLIEDADGDLEAKASMHGSASIKMKAWDLLPKSKMPSQQVELIEPAHGGLLFRLPSWAKPSGVGGKIEQEHALKRHTPNR